MYKKRKMQTLKRYPTPNTMKCFRPNPHKNIRKKK